MMMLVAIIVAGIAAVTDLRTAKIPNWLTAVAAVFAFVASALYGNMLRSLEGGVLCSLIPLHLFARRLPVCGGGDVKLLVVMGALCQPARGLLVEGLAFCLASIVLCTKARVRFAPAVFLAVLAVELGEVSGVLSRSLC